MIDLQELIRICDAATQGERCVIGAPHPVHEKCYDIAIVGDDPIYSRCGDGDADYAVATPPHVVRTLAARVLALENCMRWAIDEMQSRQWPQTADRLRDKAKLAGMP